MTRSHEKNWNGEEKGATQRPREKISNGDWAVKLSHMGKEALAPAIWSPNTGIGCVGRGTQWRAVDAAPVVAEVAPAIVDTKMGSAPAVAGAEKCTAPAVRDASPKDVQCANISNRHEEWKMTKNRQWNPAHRAVNVR